MGRGPPRCLDAFAREPQFLNLVRLELAASTEPAVRSVIGEVTAGFFAGCGRALEGIDAADAAAIASIMIALVFDALDQLTIRGGSLERVQRRVAVATRMILEFQDPTVTRQQAALRRR